MRKKLKSWITWNSWNIYPNLLKHSENLEILKSWNLEVHAHFGKSWNHEIHTRVKKLKSWNLVILKYTRNRLHIFRKAWNLEILNYVNRSEKSWKLGILNYDARATMILIRKCITQYLETESWKSWNLEFNLSISS